MNSEYYDHIDLSVSALDLLIHHMEKANSLTAQRHEQLLLAGCLPALEQLRQVLDELNPENQR